MHNSLEGLHEITGRDARHELTLPRGMSGTGNRFEYRCRHCLLQSVHTPKVKNPPVDDHITY